MSIGISVRDLRVCGGVHGVIDGDVFERVGEYRWTGVLVYTHMHSQGTYTSVLTMWEII